MDERNGSARQVVAELVGALRPSGPDGARVRVLGHRGAPTRGCPDNSVAAVTEALRHGADGVEIDVRLTADDALVCLHDPFVRTRTGARRDVAASTSGDLLGVSGRPAALAEVLAAVQRPGGAQVVVEAKPVADAAVAVRTPYVLADVLGAEPGDAEVTVSSFDPALLAAIRMACADLPVRTALLGHTSVPAAAVVRRAHEDGHDEVHLSLVAVRRAPQTLERAHALALSVTLWTVNRRRDLRWAAGLGADAVITDDVPAARGELDVPWLGELVDAVRDVPGTAA